MSKKVKKPKTKTNLDLLKQIRKDWGDFNPVTRVVKDKKKYDRKRNPNKVRDY